MDQPYALADAVEITARADRLEPLKCVRREPVIGRLLFGVPVALLTDDHPVTHLGGEPRLQHLSGRSASTQYRQHR